MFVDRSKIVVILLAAALSMPSILTAGSVQYHYDEAGRLTGATYDNGTQITYTYDNAGNRATKTVTLGDICPSDLDGDLDVDGADLAEYAAGNGSVTLEEFAGDFGKTNCP